MAFFNHSTVEIWMLHIFYSKIDVILSSLSMIFITDVIFIPTSFICFFLDIVIYPKVILYREIMKIFSINLSEQRCIAQKKYVFISRAVSTYKVNNKLRFLIQYIWVALLGGQLLHSLTLVEILLKISF